MPLEAVTPKGEPITLEGDWSNLQPYTPPTRPQRLGAKLHPVAVTDAWYAADCPPDYPMPADLPVPVRVQWFISRRLRGIRGGGL